MTKKKKSIDKSKGGRPTKYKEEYCEMLIDHLASGKPFRSFGRKIGVSVETIYEWTRKHPEFLDALKDGRLDGYEKYLELITQGARGEIQGFNATAAIWFGKNVYKWTDRIEQKVDAKITLENLIEQSFEDE